MFSWCTNLFRGLLRKSESKWLWYFYVKSILVALWSVLEHMYYTVACFQFHSESIDVHLHVHCTGDHSASSSQLAQWCVRSVHVSAGRVPDHQLHEDHHGRGWHYWRYVRVLCRALLCVSLFFVIGGSACLSMVIHLSCSSSMICAHWRLLHVSCIFVYCECL